VQEHDAAKVTDFSPRGGATWKEQQKQEPGRRGGVQSAASSSVLGAKVLSLRSGLSKFQGNNIPVPTDHQQREHCRVCALGGVSAMHCLEDAGTCTEAIPVPFVGWKPQPCLSPGTFAQRCPARCSRAGSGTATLRPHAQFSVPMQVIK